MAEDLLRDENDYSGIYNTELTQEEEKDFKEWAKKNNREKDSYDYDIRGAWKEMKSGKMTQAENGHLGDKYKKPNHPTFSDESIYSKDGMKGGHWGENNGRITFTPSEHNLKNMSPKQLRKYFKEVEPDVDLSIPSEFERVANKIYGDSE